MHGKRAPLPPPGELRPSARKMLYCRARHKVLELLDVMRIEARHGPTLAGNFAMESSATELAEIFSRLFDDGPMEGNDGEEAD